MAFPLSLLLGSVAGLGEKCITAWNKKKDQEFALKRDAALHKNDMEMMKAEVDKATRIADTEALTKTVESQDREISVLPKLAERAGPRMTAFMSFWSIMLTVYQKSVRPNLSYGLFAYACVMTWQLHQRVNGLDAFDNNEALMVYKTAILSMFEMTELALSYWFTSRPTSKWTSMFKGGK